MLGWMLMSVLEATSGWISGWIPGWGSLVACACFYPEFAFHADLTPYSGQKHAHTTVIPSPRPTPRSTPRSTRLLPQSHY